MCRGSSLLLLTTVQCIGDVRAKRREERVERMEEAPYDQRIEFLLINWKADVDETKARYVGAGEQAWCWRKLLLYVFSFLCEATARL